MADTKSNGYTDVSVGLTPARRALLEKACQRAHSSRGALVERLLNWFLDCSPEAQTLFLMGMSADEAERRAAAIVKANRQAEREIA